MDQRPGSTGTAPTGQQWAHGVGFIVVALALVIGIPAALLATSSTCACTPPPDLIVLNYAHEDAAVSWEGPGLLGLPILGISGSAVARACTTLAPAAAARSGERDFSRERGDADRQDHRARG